MKTLRCIVPGPGRADLETIDLPETGPGQLRVRTDFSLISPGTELAMFNGTHIGLPNPQNLFAKYPFPPGYAAIGTVEESGTDAFCAGMRVYFHGLHQAVQVLDPARQVVLELPAGIEPTHAPLARMAQIAHTALTITGAPAGGGAVAVIGLGLVGHFAARLYQRAGARVYGFDTLAARCRWAERAGLDNAVHVTGELVETVLGAARGKVAIGVEATGIGALAVSCLKMVEDRGTVALLGSPRNKVEIDTYELIHRSGARLVGAHERLVPLIAAEGLDQRAVSRDMLAAIASGEMGVGSLPLDIVRPDTLAESYRTLDERKDEVLAVLLDWRGEQDRRMSKEGKPK